MNKTDVDKWLTATNPSPSIAPSAAGRWTGRVIGCFFCTVAVVLGIYAGTFVWLRFLGPLL